MYTFWTRIVSTSWGQYVSVFASKEKYQIHGPFKDTKSIKKHDYVIYLGSDPSPAQSPNIQLFNVQSVFVKFDASQFICKESKTWTLLKIIGVNKFFLLVIFDHGEKFICFPSI